MEIVLKESYIELEHDLWLILKVMEIPWSDDLQFQIRNAFFPMMRYCDLKDISAVFEIEFN